MERVVGDITRADGSVVQGIEVSLYVEPSRPGHLGSWKGGFYRPIDEDWLFGVPAEVLHVTFADGRVGSSFVTNAQLHSRAGLQYVEFTGVGALETPATDDGAALLDARGYRHSDSGFWFDRAALKVFTDEYARHHEAGQIEADLAENGSDRVKVYSDWPLVPEAQRELDRLFNAGCSSRLGEW